MKLELARSQRLKATVSILSMLSDNQETFSSKLRYWLILQGQSIRTKKLDGGKDLKSFSICEVTEILQMSRNLLFKHGNFLTVFKDSMDRVFLQPGNFLKLLLIADTFKK
jgi:hypothetical protein